MLTLDQLATIKANRDKLKAYSVSSSVVLNMQADIDTMLDEIEQLHAALITKDNVLSQFADSGNWEYDPPLADESFPLWAWTGDDNPVHLANQALSEGKE